MGALLLSSLGEGGVDVEKFFAVNELSSKV
jgi:hypothetical protein